MGRGILERKDGIDCGFVIGSSDENENENEKRGVGRLGIGHEMSMLYQQGLSDTVTEIYIFRGA